jgi:hypothetical protein
LTWAIDLIWQLNARLASFDRFLLLPGTPIMIGARAYRILPPEQHVGEGISISARHVPRLQPSHRADVGALNSRFN